ncbi:MAG: Gfo/Idh/MocA family oxidoreductase [Pseudomonadota bacterium]
MKAAVIGMGYLGRFHAQKLAQSERVTLHGVADVSADARERAQEEHDGIVVTGDYRELIDQVDAVTVVTPTTSHFEIAKTFLEAGRHVLLEKPMTVTVAEADELIALADARGVVLQIGHLERFNPATVAMAERASGPQFFEAYRVAPFRERGIEVDVVLDLMIHDIDIVHALTERPITDIVANGTVVFSDKPDIVNARLQFEGGCVANLTASRVSTKTERKIRMFQQDAYMSADLHLRYLKIATKQPPPDGEQIPKLEIEQFEYPEHDALQLEIDDFLNAIEGGGAPRVTGSQGRRALATAVEIGRLIGGA